MIPYEELVAALDTYVARNGGTPQSARAPAGYTAAPATVEAQDLPGHEVELPSFDEHHDPDLAHGAQEDATHVGASPGGASMPPPLQPVATDESNEIDIGDVLTDDDL